MHYPPSAFSATRDRYPRNRGRLAAVLLGWVVAVAALSAGAQPPAPASNAGARPARGGGAMITPNYKDADLGQIIEAVSQLTGKNFIIDPRVKAQVTMLSASPMTPDAFYQAFLALLEVHGFVAVPSGKVIKIVPDANARTMPSNDLPDKLNGGSDELVTQVIAVRNVSAAQLVPVLRPLIPQYGHLAAYPASNVLIISDHAANVARMLKIIERIDQTTGDDIDIIHLEHASATETVRVINTLATGQAAAEGGAPTKVIADDRTNSVLISGEKNARLRLRALVTHLDTPLTAGGETQVRYLKYADSDKIAAKLKEQISGTAGATGATGAPGGTAVGTGASERTVIWSDPSTNALIITAPAKVMRTLMGVIDHLDIRRAQVQVEAIIVEITGDKSIDLGVNWAAYANNGTIPAATFNTPVGGTAIGDLISAAVGIASGTSSATTTTTASAASGITVPTGTTFAIGKYNSNGGTNFAALLRAVAGVANTNIISTPSVTTLDNQEAQIKVTQEVPFVTGQYTSGTTQTTGGVVNPFQTIQRQEVGIILKITPQITDDGTILMKIDQEVSSLAQSAIKTVDVITNKRTISTKVLAEDGEVVVLGGLIQDNLTEGEQRVPLLGSIPFIGELFRTRNSEKIKNNLMVFLRPTILLDGAQVATETAAKYNYVRDIELARNKGKAQLLPGERQPTLPDLKTLEPAVEPGAVPKAKGYKSTQLNPQAPPAPAITPPPAHIPAADDATGIVPTVEPRLAPPPAAPVEPPPQARPQ